MSKKHTRTIIDAQLDPGFWGRPGYAASRAAWFAVDKAIFGLPMTDTELAIYQQCTARTTPPAQPFGECWIACGRRGGKSEHAARIGVFAAVSRDWRGILSPGERGVVMCLAADRKQAGVLHNYARSLIVDTPMLRRMLVREVAGVLELSNGINIEIGTASFRTSRGRTIVCAIADEAAFWRDESSANPDIEVIRALRPGMATVPGALLLCISSPYSKRGALWQAYQKHYGKDDSRVLFWQADSRTMNPTLPQEFIDDAYADDPVSAASEFGAAFRPDISSFLDAEMVESLARTTPIELPPRAGVRYFGFVDPSGGRGDDYVLAIAHKESDGRAVVDAVQYVRPPFDPEAATSQFADVLREYGIKSVVGDAYGAEWVAATYKKFGIHYTRAEKSKNEIYGEVLPLFTRGVVELPPDRRLLTQLASLERRTSRVGRDIIDHSPGAHDDLANGVCGALWITAGRQERTLGTAIGSIDKLFGFGNLDPLYGEGTQEALFGVPGATRSRVTEQ